jgi:hypothetical protein
VTDAEILAAAPKLAEWKRSGCIVLHKVVRGAEREHLQLALMIRESVDLRYPDLSNREVRFCVDATMLVYEADEVIDRQDVRLYAGAELETALGVLRAALDRIESDSRFNDRAERAAVPSREQLLERFGTLPHSAEQQLMELFSQR